MYKKELDNHIRNKTISNSFIFYGESHFLIDMYTKMLTNIEDALTLSFYYDEYDYSSAKAHLSQGSLFGDRNILIIKTDKKVPKKELEVLIDLCQKNEDNIFVYAYYGSDFKAYTKAFTKKNTMVVRFFHPNSFEAQNILMHLAQEAGVKISKYTISHLLAIHNGDIALCANEIEKFKIFNKEITTKDVEQLVYGLSEINLDSFIEKILTKKEFLNDLQTILEHGEDEIKILTSITSFIMQLYMFNIYIRVNGAPNPIDILGYKPPQAVVDKKANLSMKFKLQTYSKMQKLLLGAELKMKNINVDKEAILISTLIRLQKLI